MATLINVILLLGGIGCLCGLALALAARYLAVAEDPRIGEIAKVLSGANCGACGYAGCSAYAAAVAKGEAPANGCVPGGKQTADAVAKILGVCNVATEEPKVAFVKCNGTTGAAARKFAYNGITDCAAAAAIAGGDKLCSHGCLGYGTCANQCPVHAIAIEDGVAVVNETLCIGCGACVKICPRHVIEMVPRSAKIRVRCNSTDSGAQVRKYCKSGCIGCRICAKFSPEGAIVFDGALARVDYGKSAVSNDSVAKCPMKCLVRM